MDSFQSFRVMEGFSDSLAAGRMKNKLEYILSQPKPFREFKHAVESSDYRQDWYDFRRQANVAWVKEQFFVDD